ncbi:hypothetical protein IFM89_007807 [Coptis chinensis]|uniref:NADP-dependent oxidoreductase domain-containing protein n=1 Tax=Coptis chinensis TaxID=261450 RepID=A0A835IUW0_9MAGN|nr:hypothetical protein IFM89_007807 [Coptis chinensis]
MTVGFGNSARSKKTVESHIIVDLGSTSNSEVRSMGLGLPGKSRSTKENVGPETDNPARLEDSSSDSGDSDVLDMMGPALPLVVMAPNEFVVPLAMVNPNEQSLIPFVEQNHQELVGYEANIEGLGEQPEPFASDLSSVYKEKKEKNMRMVNETTLSSGHVMPLLGMGTAAFPEPPPELVESSVIAAIELGYRHFDTASAYQSEPPLGRAISEALRRGLVTSRSELFVTTKLWPGHAHPDLVLPALRESLGTLELDYVDLYLIHFHVRFNVKEISLTSATKKDLLPLDVKGTWQAMEECQRLGLAKSIGVSNFSCKKLSQLLDYATIPPAVNQVEMHPLWQQRKLRDYCAEKGIHVSAFSPLGGKGAFWGSNAVFDSEQIKQIAQAKGKSVAQICLRWAFENGVSFLPKSFNKERLKENMKIFDWELSNEELQKMSTLPQSRIFTLEFLVSEDGPFKSVSDLWDGEM